LITGGAGYIGSHTSKLLSDKGYNCIIVDNLISGHREAVRDCLFEQTDILDNNSLNNIFEKYQIDGVIHFAAFAYVGESVTFPEKYYINNVTGTLSLLNTMLKYNVKNIVFSSSCSSYGNPQYIPIDENHIQRPISPYGKTKFFVEQILSDYYHAYGLKYICLRYFNAAGASPDIVLGESHNPETHLIPLVLKAIKGDINFINIYGNDYDTYDGTCIRDYIHVDDLAMAHYLAYLKLNDFCGCINLGSGYGVSVSQIISHSEKITGKKCSFKFSKRREGDPPVLIANINKANKILNWKPSYTNIEDIISTAWSWELSKKF
jgi:UDP-glucose 4-epimerase